MKNTFSFFIAISILSLSCTKYTQIFQTKPTTPGITSGSLLYFENDTVRITYSFWQKKGTLAYNIYNKLSIPIYIDWKKSSFVKDGQKYNYWSDEMITKSSSRSSSFDYTDYGYYGLMGLSSGASISQSHSFKPERITFLAPHSNIFKRDFILYPFTDDKFKSDAIAGSINNPTTKKPVTIAYKEFNVENSPLKFRNFLTLSTSEKFETEVYIDNGFYVSRISQMKKNIFSGKEIRQRGSDRMVFELPFKNPDLFYIDAR